MNCPLLTHLDAVVGRPFKTLIDVAEESGHCEFYL